MYSSEMKYYALQKMLIRTYTPVHPKERTKSFKAGNNVETYPS